jgi:AcrR family transcriptional regulator
MTDDGRAYDEERLSRLERSQRARRDRIHAAVLELAAEGGYDAVQVRDVADRAGVALRTLYNYYDSRENLIHEAMIEWRRQVASESVGNVSGATLEARLLSLMRHTFEAFAEAPLLFETFMRLGLRAGEPDPWTHKTQTEAFDDVLAGTDPSWADDFTLVIGRFVQAELALAAQGQVAIDDVWPDIERVVKRMVRDRPLRRGERR